MKILIVKTPIYGTEAVYKSRSHLTQSFFEFDRTIRDTLRTSFLHEPFVQIQKAADF